ncbi:MAG: hypothetical protein EBX41_09340 [Chitinophagia bacterium]|nr:hypothetical protein [Chitinophagia bacterium]
MEETKKKAGRMRQKVRKSKYNDVLKREVARCYLGGDLSVREVAKLYNINYQYVSKWSEQYSYELRVDQTPMFMTDQEQKELDLLKKQYEALKKKLEYEQMKNFALETMVDLAKSELGIDLRKNSGAKQPKE